MYKQPIIKNKLRVLCFFAVLNLLIHDAHAQFPYKYFQSVIYDKSKGLQVDETIECLSTDNKGFLWVSTTNGLFRFSGILFKGFPVKKDVPGTLPSYNIRFFVQDKKGAYWLNPLHKGIWNYNDSLGLFSPFILKNDTIAITNYELSEPYFDSENYLWVNLHGKGLMKINTTDSTYRFYNLKDPVRGYEYRSTSWVTKIMECRKGYFWLTTNNGLLLLNEKTGQVTRAKDILQPDGYEKTLSGLFIDKDSSLWIGSWGHGLQHYMPDKGRWESYFILPSLKNNTQNITADIYPLNDDELLVGSNYGLLVFNKKTKQFFKCRDADAQSSTAIVESNSDMENLTGWKFFSDNNGHLFATDFFNKIITRINLTQKNFGYIHLYPGKVYNTGAFLYSYAAGNENGKYILASSWGRGIYLYDFQNKILSPVDANPKAPYININDIFQQGDSLWFSSNIGLVLYSLSQNKFLNIPFPALVKAINGSEVTSFAMNKYEAFAGTYHGVIKYNLKTNTIEWFTKENGKLPANPCFRLYADKAGNIWISAQSAALVYYQSLTQKIVWYDAKKGIAEGNIEDITEQADGSILFSSRGNGVYKITRPLASDENIKLLTVADGLASNRVYSLFTDSDGYTWFSASNGLSVFNPGDSRYYSFYKEDGLLQDDIFGRCAEISKGHIVLPLKYGFTIINRDSLLRSKPIELPIAIQRFTVNGRAFAQNIQYVHNIKLPYTQNNLSIDFSAQCFDNPSAILYNYRLLGLDTNWTFIYSRTNLSLYALPPGSYTLQLYAFNKNTHTEGQYYELAITITPPFWKTWWFIILVFLIVTAGIYALYHYRLQHAIKLERMRSAISSDLHDEVGATLSSISIFSQTAKQLSQINPQRSAAILDRIGESSRQMVDSMSDIVWSINPSNDSFDKMLLRMRTYATELMEAKEINLHWHQPENIQRLTLGMEQRKNFYLIFKEGINNAAKYSKANNLSVDIHVQASIIQLIIKDDGIGFNTDAVKKGNGLNTMQQRAGLLNGKLDMGSDDGKGTIITLSFLYKS